MEVVNIAFNEICEILKSVVPPCQTTVDDAFNYEVRAIKKNEKGETVSDKLFGYVVKHADSITVGFDKSFGTNIRKELFSDYLIQKMNHESRIRIHEMTHQLHKDLQYATDHLLRYYVSMDWV